MDGAKVEPPQKKKRKNPTAQPSLTVSFSSLPDEIVLSCLARIPKPYYRSLSLVSKSFYSLLSSRELYVVRSQIGATEPCLFVNLYVDHCLCTLLNPDKTLIINDDIKGKLSLIPVKLSSFYYHIGFSSTNVAVGSEFYQIGGTVNGKRSRAVRVFDCLSHTSRHAPKMRVARAHAESYFLDGKIYVVGGCRREDDSNWGEVFDLKIQTWKPLPSPRDNVFRSHEVVVLGGRLYVITKPLSHEVVVAYDPNEGRWKETLELDFGLFYRLSRKNLLNGPSCVIENVIFNEYGGTYWWWHASCNGKVQGLDDLYTKRGRAYRTIQLINYGGKLVIIWDECFQRYCPQKMRIWCAVIRLEKRSNELVVCGKIERLNLMCTVPKEYNLLTCLSVLL